MTKQIARKGTAHSRAERVAAVDAGWVQVVSQAGRTVTLADPEMKRSVENLKKEVTRSKADALDFLHRAGIVTPKGRLTKVYGG
jgi:DNA integrity scanning protein DisA with diadenylate cyclase activity